MPGRVAQRVWSCKSYSAPRTPIWHALTGLADVFLPRLCSVVERNGTERPHHKRCNRQTRRTSNQHTMIDDKKSSRFKEIPMNRKLTAFLLVMIVALAGGIFTAPIRAADAVTITYWHTHSDAETAQLAKLID